MKITRKKRSFFVRGGNLKEAVEYEIMPDRIAALTYIMAGKTTGGRVTIKNISYNKHINPVLDALQKSRIETASHPGFPTDAGAIVMPYLALKKGKKTEYVENVFENRMSVLEELKKAGADIEVLENRAKIKGVKKINASQFEGKDLRAAAGLTIAALAINGKSEITGIKYIERGYEKFIETLKSLGAEIDVIEPQKRRFSLGRRES